MKSGCLGWALLGALSTVTTWGGDWPQYAGPNHDRSTSERIQKVFPANGPKTIWRVTATDGFSSYAVSGGKAFTLVLRNIEGAPREVVVAADANTGKEIWAQPLGPIKLGDGGQQGTSDNQGGDGPRSTPSIDGNRVYVLSAKLVLSCFDSDNGKVVFQPARWNLSHGAALGAELGSHGSLASNRTDE